MRIAEGKLGPGITFRTEDERQGVRHLEIAAGDRLMITKNSRKLGVRNGTLGTVEMITPNKITVSLDNGRRVSFAPKKFPHFDLGYALTVHKSQGITAERVHVLLSRAFDRHAAYVALTRHRERLDLYYSREEMGADTDIAKPLSRSRRKNLALDFVRTEVENQRLAAMVRAPAAPKPPS